MTIVATVGVVIGGLGLAHARCAWRAHDRLLLEMLALRLEHRREEIGWQGVAADHKAEVGAWRQAAELHESARRAMREAVASQSRQTPPRAARSTISVRGVGERHRQALGTRPAGLGPDEVQRVVKGHHQ